MWEGGVLVGADVRNQWRSLKDPVRTGKNSSRPWCPREETSTVRHGPGPGGVGEVQGRVLRSMVSWSVRQGNGGRILSGKQRQHGRQVGGDVPLGLPGPTGQVSGHVTHSRPLWNVLPGEGLPDVVGGAHSKGSACRGEPHWGAGWAGPDLVADL